MSKQLPEFDLKLSVLSCIVQPGETITREDIARVCDCSRFAIYRIEKQAIAKFKKLATTANMVEFLR